RRAAFNAGGIGVVEAEHYYPAGDCEVVVIRSAISLADDRIDVAIAAPEPRVAVNPGRNREHRRGLEIGCAVDGEVICTAVKIEGAHPPAIARPVGRAAERCVASEGTRIIGRRAAGLVELPLTDETVEPGDIGRTNHVAVDLHVVDRAGEVARSAGVA